MYPQNASSVLEFLRDRLASDKPIPEDYLTCLEEIADKYGMKIVAKQVLSLVAKD